jgi:hypothetical protein
MALRCVLLALAMIWAFGDVAQAAPKSSKKGSVVCKSADDKAKKDDDDEDDDDDDEGIRFQVAGACAKLTGGVSYTYQQAKQTGTGLPIFVNKNGTVSRGTSSNTVSANIGLETTRQIGPVELKTSVSADWSKATGDGTQNGSAQVSGWSVGAGSKIGTLTVGYTGTLMSFWEGDFLTTANSPGRSASTIIYEYKIDDRNTVAAALESNLPTSPETNTGIKSVDFSDPVYTLRWRYERDDWTLHLSGLVRRADFSQSPLLPFFPDTATVRTGWAVSAGVKVPTKFIGEDDEFNTQWTYTSDASAYLGISTDLTVYQHTVRSLGPTTGWSAVAGFHHVWSEQFESNVFASFVKLKANLLLASPEARSLRTGINLFWKPIDHLKFGIEFGTVDMQFDPQGVRGIFDGAGGRAYIGVFSVSAEL